MTSGREYSFLTFLFFCILLQQSILNCNASIQGCIEPKFDAKQKITVDYFFGYVSDTDVNDESPGDNLCKIVNGSNGLISMVWRMGADLNVDSSGKVICDSELQCLKERRQACNYKYYKAIYNDCSVSMLPAIGGKVADCVCEAASDDILVANRNDYVKYKATVVPALVVNQVFDPCFTDYSYESMKLYFCKAYNNALPLCK